MTPPSPNDAVLDQVYITRLPAPDRTPSRILALGTALTIYAALGAGLAALWRSPVRRSLPQPSQAIVLQELDDFAPPPPPPPGGGAREAGPKAVPRSPEFPAETPRTLPTEALLPPPVPAGASVDPRAGLPASVPGGEPGGVPGGLPGGIPGGRAGSTLVPPRFDAAYLRNPAPHYPAPSRRLGEEGRVILRVLVDPEGRARQLEIKASSGFPRLDQVALATVRLWRFIPARHGDLPMAAWVLVPVTFQLEA